MTDRLKTVAVVAWFTVLFAAAFMAGTRWENHRLCQEWGVRTVADGKCL